MLPIDKVTALIDKGTEFFEFSLLAGLEMKYGNIPRAGVLTGQLYYILLYLSKLYVFSL